jgi:hypothetical protein
VNAPIEVNASKTPAPAAPTCPHCHAALVVDEPTGVFVCPHMWRSCEGYVASGDGRVLHYGLDAEHTTAAPTP